MKMKNEKYEKYIGHSLLAMVVLSFLYPATAFAQDVDSLAGTILTVINAIIPVIFGLAVLFFIYGLVLYILRANDSNAQTEARSIMIWGIVIIFVMVSIWGFVNILITTFDLNTTKAELPQINSGGGGGPAQTKYIITCLTGDVLVTMTDGSKKVISDIQVGDSVIGNDGDPSIVVNTDLSFLTERQLYGFNEETGGFVTEDHPFMTTEGWQSINPDSTAQYFSEFTVGKLEVGDVLITQGGTVEIQSIESYTRDSDTRVYNFMLEDGRHTYYADDFLVHNYLSYDEKKNRLLHPNAPELLNGR